MSCLLPFLPARFLGIIGLGLLFSAKSWAAPTATSAQPPIENLQTSMIQKMKKADFRLQGKIRSKKNTYPFVLRTKGYDMVYEFEDQPLQIKVDLDPDNSKVQRRTSSSGKWKTLSRREMGQPILGTDLTYEDLSLDIVKWENVKPIGEDSIKTFDTWAYSATPNKVSRYASADYWISKKPIAVIRVDAKNAKGQVIKRVEINGVQKIDGTTMIKEMQASTLIPGTERSKSRTWVEIQSGKKGASGL